MQSQWMEISDQLRREMDTISTRLVLGLPAGEASEELRAASVALRDLSRRAAGEGVRDVPPMTEILAAKVEEAASGASADIAALERALRNGVSLIEEVLDALPRAGAPAAAKAGGGPTAQETSPEQSPLAMLQQDPELLSDFVVEAREHLSNVERMSLVVEREPGDREAMASLFRSFHTIKGLAGFLELNVIQEVAHHVETVLDMARNGELAIHAGIIDMVLASADFLARGVAQVEQGVRGQPVTPLEDHAPLVERIDRSARPDSSGAATAPAGAVMPAAGTAPAATLAGGARGGGEQGASAVKVDTAKLDFLVDMVGELVIAQSLLRHDPELAGLENPRLARNLSHMGRVTTEVQKTAMSLRMVPIGTLFRRMERLVRDLSRRTGRQAELVTSGEETELDRTLVEQLADPLMHMIRNSMDHGIEDPEARLAAGKPAAGRILLRASHQAGQILIEVRDDGRGLDRARILAKAREKGLVQNGEALSDTEVFNLIFEAGFSTAERVSEVSGRGVGMDVVRKNLQALRGRVDIQSAPGEGTAFLMKLPLTLAIIDGLVVAVGAERYIVPIHVVREMFRPTAEMISTVEGRLTMALVRSQLLPVIRLDQRFGVEGRAAHPCEALLIVIEGEGKLFCLMVDEFIGKQEVVIKSLGEMLKVVPGIAAGAILGDGRVGLILDVDRIF